MALQAPDLMSLLCLDGKFSKSPFGANHRTILIDRDFANSGDFVFNSLLQHFGRREPNTQILLVTLSQDWIHHSTCAAKCGFNLRKKQNMGNIEILDIMNKSLEDVCAGTETNYCNYIMEQVRTFVCSQTTQLQDKQTISNQTPKPMVVMFDDLSLLLALGIGHGQVFRLVSLIDALLRQASLSLPDGRLTHLIIQTLSTNVKIKEAHLPEDNDLNFLVANLSNMSDLCITLKPLDSGHSTRVDGTIKICDNRLPVSASISAEANRQTMGLHISLLSTSSADIGSVKAFFYKLSDRRVRITSNALIF